MKKIASALDPLWYKDAVIYELHVRAFADSNNDGIGDFQGLISKLDYLQELGVTCLWLLPFFPSPLRDDGYDISNYVDVNPSYGTIDDFRAFLDAAHQRGMQVMIELVINHTSDQHPWFKAARQAPPGSPQREMYVWSNSEEKYRNARIIFTDTEKSNWTWDETAKAYYWHRFFSHQPDLNFDNPLVLEEVLKAMRFWLDMGVDALRLDAIPYLVERDGTNCENLSETHAVIKSIRAAIDEDYANRLMLAEANQWPADVRPYFGDGDECHMAFHFPLMPRIYMALRQEDRLPITDIMAQTPPIPDNCQWGLFLRNHDELTLEMVTADERDYMYFAYSADPRMRINVGIRRRLAPLVDNNRRRIELLNSILFSFPGTPIIYYGDEIGMGDNIYLGDRNGVRTPMQWTSDRNAGFSKCDPARLYFPVIMDPIYGYQVVNVEAQESDQSSLLHWTRNMIALRKLFQVFGRGTLTFLNPANRKVLAYLRDLDRGDGTHETVLCVANLSRFAQPVSLDLSAYAGSEPMELIGYVPFPTITAEPYALSLAPYSFLWLELQPAAARPDVSDELPQDTTAATFEEAQANEVAVQELISGGWSAFIASLGQPLLESALPDWLPRQRWFGAKTRRIKSVKVLEWVELSRDTGSAEGRPSLVPPALFYLEINYGDNSTDVYQLPLAFSTGEAADQIRADRPLAIIATVPLDSGDGVLHDGSVREDLRQALLGIIERNTALELNTPQSAAAQAVAETAGVNQTRDIGKDPASGMEESAGPHPLAGSPVAPLPLTAQPGEAATPPRGDGHTAPGPNTQRLQPRESPSAGDPASRKGVLLGRASAAFLAHRGTRELPARVGSAEQSNTSVLFGKQLIMKIFRRLQSGENPDVEIGRFLTEVAHFDRIAPFLGQIDIIPGAGEKTTVAMLQGLVANQGDGWEWFLEQLAPFFETAAGAPPPLEVPTSSFIGQIQIPADLRERARSTLAAAALLGRRTAEMHLALATPTSDPAFGAEPFSSEDLNRDSLRIQEQIAAAMDALKGKFISLPDEATGEAAVLLTRRRELLDRARALAGAEPGGKRIRIHGDYHLGQTLRVKGATEEQGDFVLLDFEGEPARPLSERRRKQSPLRDVAGMVRSFSYVANSALAQFLVTRESASEIDLRAWARLWENAASAEFLQAYRSTMAADASLLPPPPAAQALFSAYVLEKALYELLYELNNRPTWLRIPVTGILSM
ncbi:maltose alpha-D-glucosyltransferase [Acidobacteria bacterium AB60]|nr:maltose alpha-D-glucosyltransferase [Acidobacteria bacterium AB60]